jgi:hypothetical protein
VSQLNLDYISIPYFFKIHFNVIVICTEISKVVLSLLVFRLKLCMDFSFLYDYTFLYGCSIIFKSFHEFNGLISEE